MSLITVVIPTYNSPDSLKRAIDSVFNQTYDNWELIVVDDASEYKIKDIVGSYDDGRVKYFRHDKNRGGSAARNTGITKASGEYIAFLDDDDYWYRKKLQLQINEIKKSPECIAVYCDREMDGEEDRIIPILREKFRKRQTERTSGGDELIKHVLMKQFDIGGTSTLLIRKETVINIGGFDENLPRHQDIEILIRILEEGNIGYVNKILSKKYGHSTPSLESLIKSKRRLLSKHHKKVINLEMNGHVVLGVHRLELARFSLEEGNISAALKYMSSGSANSIGQYYPIIKLFLINLLRESIPFNGRS